MSLKILLLANLILFTGLVSAEPTKLVPSDLVLEHPCAPALLRYLESKFIELGAFNGTAQVDSLSQLTNALENAGVDPDEAREIGELYRKFRSKEFNSVNLKRLARWMDEFEEAQTPSATTQISGSMRAIVCVPDLRCSISDPPINSSYFPSFTQIVLIAPAPKPGVAARPYFNALIEGIAAAQGQSIFLRWVNSIMAIQERRGRHNDPYAQFVANDGRYSGTFGNIFAHLHANLIGAELIELANPSNARRLIERISEASIPEIRRMDLPQTDLVLETIGIRRAQDVFPVAQALVNQVEATNQAASIPNN